ncbi:ATP-binding cassette domain-containing protein [Candidatus Mycoplasma pogonae]
MKKSANKFLKVKNLNVVLNKETILKEINFSVEQGELVSIIGPSGSGKTTLLNAIAGLVEKKGDIEINGLKVNLNIGYVFQDFNLYENISVYKNIYLSIKNSYYWRILRKLEMLKYFDSNNKFGTKLLFEEFAKQKDFIFSNLKKQKKFYWKINLQIWNAFFKFISLKKVERQIILQNLESQNDNFCIKKQEHKIQKFFNKLIKFNKDNNQKKEKKQISFKNKNCATRFWKNFTVRNLARTNIIDVANNLEIESILNKKSSKLSGGQKQRVSIAKALVKKSDLILLDEPFAAFDAKLKEKARDWLRGVNKKFKTTMLFVTHDQNDAMLISDKIIFINKKTISQYSTPQEIFDNPKNIDVAKFIGYPEIVHLKNDGDIQYFIRSNKIKIIKNSKSQSCIKDVRTNGNLDIIKIFSYEFNKELEIISEINLYKKGDAVDLVVKPKDILKFSAAGERIYES